MIPMQPDLMATFQETALYIRTIHVSPCPHETARQISAEQFRPNEDSDGTIKREPEPANAS
jgi:hypothetical protein